MRVPRITGFPNMTLWLISMRPKVVIVFSFGEKVYATCSIENSIDKRRFPSSSSSLPGWTRRLGQGHLRGGNRHTRRLLCHMESAPQDTGDTAAFSQLFASDVR